ALAAGEALTDLPRYLAGAGYHPTGLVELRAAVATLYEARGLPTAPEQIMIASGVQHALDLALRLLVPAGQAGPGAAPALPHAPAPAGAPRGRLLTHRPLPEARRGAQDAL